MSYLLFSSGVAMVAVVFILPFIILSGRVIAGLYSPKGWPIIWGLMTWGRWLPSFCQVLMCRVNDKSKKRVRAKMGTDNNNTDKYSSTTRISVREAQSFCNSTAIATTVVEDSIGEDFASSQAPSQTSSQNSSRTNSDD